MSRIRSEQEILMNAISINLAMQLDFMWQLISVLDGNVVFEHLESQDRYVVSIRKVKE